MRPAVVALVVCGCGAASAPVATPVEPDALTIVAEGPCARLSMQPMGDRRFVIFGDTGYDLELWTPGEELAAAQSVVELADGAAWLDRSWTAGLPTDGRGYVPATIELGGEPGTHAWLSLTRTRYAPHGTGKLFARERTAFVRDGAHWEPVADPSAAPWPASARSLPPLSTEAICAAPERRFLPLSHAITPAGGAIVAGRCQGASITPHPDTTLVVAHGAPGAASWRVERASPRARLEGHVNAALFARSDDDVYLSAYEPFEPSEGRQGFLAHWDGSSWQELEPGFDGGIMSIAGGPTGPLYLAAGTALFRRDEAGRAAPVALPRPSFVTGDASLHVHTVRVARAELWVEASLKVHDRAPGRDGDVERWASVLWGPRGFGRYHCDDREDAANAFTEIE